MVLTARLSLLFLAFTFLQVVSSTRFKVSLPANEIESVGAHLTKRASDACADYKLVSGTANLSYPTGFQHLQKPWDENPNTTVATSPTVTAGIDRLLILKVPGLNGVTIEEVMEKLQQHGCLSFPFGGPVRDQFLGVSPVDLDMETNCAAEEILNICKETWGPSNCSPISSNMIVHIGDSATDGETDVIDTSNWNETFFGSGIALEYATNSMAYFGDVLNITIDITGHGINDTCNKNIRIPVAIDERQMWVSTNKVYRFWKLRIKGYKAIDNDTMSFIVSEAEKRISGNFPGFQSFYCKNALTGQWMSSRATCIIPKDSCQGALSKKLQYDTAFEMDLGGFWANKVKAFVEGLECNSCSATAGENACRPVSTTSPSGSVSTTSPIVIFWGAAITALLAVIPE